MKELMEILNDIRPDLDFESETKLIDDGILDSFDIITIVSEISSAFDINVNVADLVPDNFNTAEAIWKLIQEYQEK